MAQPDVISDLRSAVEDGRETVRGVARKIVGSDAPKEKIEGKRRHLQKLLDGDVARPGATTVRQIAIALGLDPAIYRSTAEARATTAQKLAAIIARLDGIEGELRGLAGRRTSTAPAADDVTVRALLSGLQGQVAALEEVSRDSVTRIGKLEKGSGARAGAKSSSAPRPASPRKKAAGR